MSLSTPSSPPTNATLKRKRDETTTIVLDQRPIIVQPDSSDPFARPRKFTPLGLLDRAKVSLAFLDTTSPVSRIFSADLHVLEKSHENGNNTSLLLANEETDSRIYVIERVEARRYALCRLGVWVQISDMINLAQDSIQCDVLLAKRRAQHVSDSAQPWWTSASVETPATSDHHGLINTIRTLPLAKNASSIAPTAELSVQAAHGSERNTQRKSVDAPKAHDDNGLADIATVSLDPLEELTKQYLDALYLSRTSLAYFSKGPLSRVRAACAGQQPEANPRRLLEFLQGLTMSSNVMERKFREGLAEFIKGLPLPGSQPIVKSKKKRKNKIKRDKTGFLPDEKEHVERWWHAGDAGVSGPGGKDESEILIRRRLPDIRKRETFLQVILVLETLALESNVAAESTEDHDGDAWKPVEADGEEASTLKSAKRQASKKKVDLHHLLETLLDKLCIWHSLDSISPVKKNEKAGEPDASTANDDLKNFCVEVIIPFYVPRIPKHAETVNKKLGGPSALSPIKRRSTATQKPGQSAIRRAPTKEVSGISRATPEDARVYSARSLGRSISNPETIPTIKREASEISLSSIPAMSTTKPTPRPRSSLMQSMKLSRREVDLSAMSQANDAKMRRKAEIQAKMQEAISNIKKPNRALAVKEMAASTDESFARATAKGSGGRGGSYQSQRSTSKTASQSVHVSATPKHPRSVAAVKSTPYRRSTATLHLPSTDDRVAALVIPSSSSKRVTVTEPNKDHESNHLTIPQTGHRSRHSLPSTSSNSNPLTETPSRGFARFLPRTLAREPGTLASPALFSSPLSPDRTRIREEGQQRRAGADDVQASPLTPAKKVVAHTPLRTDRRVNFADLPCMPADSGARNGIGDGVSATPLKGLSSLDISGRRENSSTALVEASPNAARNGRRKSGGGPPSLDLHAEPSIYTSLGWEDDSEAWV